jgi:hypothetical protein
MVILILESIVEVPSFLWTTTTIHLLIHTHRQAMSERPRQQDVEIQHTQTFAMDKASTQTGTTTEVASTSTEGRGDPAPPKTAPTAPL